MERRRKRRFLAVWMLPILAAVLIDTIGVAAVLAIGRQGELVLVPDVGGLDIPVARSHLAEDGLVMEQGDERYSSTIPAGAVIDQSPAPGSKVPRGSIVVVSVSGGSERFTMPDVIGRPASEAEEVLEKAGLGVETLAVASAEPTGIVIATVPSPGMLVTTSDRVRLTVSSGQPAPAGLTPLDLRGVVVVIDPAPLPEGTSDVADVSLSVARRLQALLAASSGNAFVTRSLLTTSATDDFRAGRASEASPTLVIGLAVAPSGSGLVVGSGKAGKLGRGISAPLAEAVSAHLRAVGPVANAPTGTDLVLDTVQAPGVRVRLGSAASATDAAAFRDPAWIDGVADALYRGIGDFLAGRTP